MGDTDIRSRILEVATRLFGHQGYNGTSVRELVEGAGVTKPTLYYHFGSKEGVYLEAIQLHMEGLEQLVHEVVTAPGSVRDRLKLLIEQYVFGAMENPDSVRFLMTCHHPTDTSGPQVDTTEMHMRRAELLRTVFEQGKQTGEIRDDLSVDDAIFALTGLLNFWVMAGFKGHPVPPDLADRTLDIFFHGVAR